MISACVTRTEDGGKNGKGKECIFPFIYQNIKYEKCTTVDSNTPWCSTKVDKSKHHIEDGGFWGACLKTCPVEGMVNINYLTLQVMVICIRPAYKWFPMSIQTTGTFSWSLAILTMIYN